MANYEKPIPHTCDIKRAIFEKVSSEYVHFRLRHHALLSSLSRGEGIIIDG